MSQVSDYTSYQNSLQRLRDSYESERAENRTSNEEKLEATKAKAEETIQAAKKDYNSRLESDRAQARDEVKRLKDEMYDQRGKSAANDGKEIQDERKSLSKFHDDIQKLSDKRVGEAKEYSEGQAERLHKQSDEKVEDALALQKKSHQQEVKDLNTELKQYQSLDRDVSQEKAEAKQKVVGDYEKDHIKEQQRIVQGYDRQVESLKKHEEELGDTFNRKLSDQAYETNKRAQDQIRAQNQSFAQIERDRAKERTYLEKNHQLEMDGMKSFGERSSTNLIAKHNEDMDHVIQNKDKTYQDYIANKEQITSTEIAQRDQKIQDLQTTNDPFKVSPFVIEKINNAAQMRTKTDLDEAESIHQKNLDAVRSRDIDERRELKEQSQAEISGFARSSRKERDLQDRQIRESVTDMEGSHSTEISDLKESKRKLGESLYRKSAMEMDAASKQKKEALEDQREVLLTDKHASLDDAQHTLRTQDREWFLKVNDLRRNFESKLSDEREEHEKLTLQTKLENDKKLRSMDRVSKRTLDDRVRSYEHQITQQELAFKEKERFLTEHYEEELDKMKRTNAHLIEKKS